MSSRIPLEGKIFGDFTAKEYLGNKKYLMICNICGEERELYSNNIQKLQGVTCSEKKKSVDLTGQQIGDWTVIKYVGNKRYLCRCNCENQTEREVLKCNLLNGTSTGCGHKVNHYGDLTGKRFGDWLVLGKEKNGYRWVCQCQCENKTISYNSSYDLCNGRTKSCGHGYNEFIDISGQQFGLWKVLKYEGNQYYKCECQCENKTISKIRKADLLRGATTSCGCNKGTKARETLIKRYGEIGPNKVGNPRSVEQINAISTKEKLLEFIKSLKQKPTSIELSETLGIELHRTLVILKSYDLIDYVTLNPQESHKEKQIVKYISELYNGEIITKDRKLLNGKELDIYIPEKKLAIEFNGDYWHSDLFKDKKYHQEKTLQCAYRGIQLIHIFEHEWNNDITQLKIKNILRNKLCDNSEIIYARETEVREIDNKTSNDFVDKYHIQNHVNASINLGIYYKDNLLGVMTFSKPRYGIQYDYEVIRLCYKDNIKVIGGTEKLFKYFLNKYNPQSIITYADISKFTGNVYLRLGFNLIKDNYLTTPNYVWVDAYTGDVLKRYETQKHKLSKLGYDTLNKTEDEIMKELDYMKVYDSGNLKLEWHKENNKDKEG